MNQCPYLLRGKEYHSMRSSLKGVRFTPNFDVGRRQNAKTCSI
jgi:hypothetical protein